MIKSNKLLESPKEGQVPTWRDIILMPFLFIVVMSIGQMASLGIMNLFTVRMAPNIESAYEIYIALLCGFGLSSLVLFLFTQNVNKRSILTLGFYKGNRVFKYLKGCFIAFVGIGSIVIILNMMGEVTLQRNEIPFGIHSILLSLMIVTAWGVQGAAEEMLIRGYMLPAIVNKLDMTKGIMISSSVFTLLHLGNEGITIVSLANILLCGLALALLAIKEESIWAVCGFHTTWNLLQGNIFGIAVSGNANTASLFTTTYEKHTLLNGGIFGIEGSLLTTLFMIILILVLVKRLAS